MSPIDKLDTLATRVRGVWSGEDARDLTPEQIIEVNDLLAQMRRTIDGVHAKIACEIARQSRPELGPEGLAKSQGYRNPAALIAAATGSSAGEAMRLVKVGDAVAPRLLLSGEKAPARHPHVAEALNDSGLTTAAASAIIDLLDRVALRAGSDATEQAEQTLVQQAPGLTLDQLSRVLTRAEAWLDPAGVTERESESRHERYLHLKEDRGMLVVSGKLDPEHGAPLKVAIEAYVSAELRAERDADSADSGRRSIPQMQADALIALAEHALGCADKNLPLAGATVVVRMNLDDLVAESAAETGVGTEAGGGTGAAGEVGVSGVSGDAESTVGRGAAAGVRGGTAAGVGGGTAVGHATIDGLATPISIATARRMAGSGGVIPCVLGDESEILDWGRTKRLFTAAQRLALVERDGGCAKCGAPPGHTKAHHIRWWARDAGPTNLHNGVLLCESCHHHIHDNGWGIRIDGRGTRATVWFIPPAHVDPARVPRLGGRARFDFAA